MPVTTKEISVTTRDGVDLAVRRVELRDAYSLVEFFRKVTPEDRRFRFLSAQAHVGTNQVMPLVEVDNWSTVNFLAFDDESGELIATAMLACDPRMELGEVAVSIHADYKGRGVGWAMLDVLSDAARERGVKQVIAIEDRKNHSAIELEREKGFEPRPFAGDPALVVLTKTF